MRLEAARRLFGLPPNKKTAIDEDELKKLYRKEAIKCHPDKCPGDEDATARFQELSEAYQILTGDAEPSEEEWSSDEEWTHGTQNAGRQRKKKKKTQQAKTAPKQRRQRKGRAQRSGTGSSVAAKDFFEHMFGVSQPTVLPSAICDTVFSWALASCLQPRGTLILLWLPHTLTVQHQNDVIIMKTRDGRNIVMPKPSSGRCNNDTIGEAERQRAQTVRQRAAAARHGSTTDCSLIGALRAALRRDPTLGLKKLTKIVQEEGGHPNASTKDVRTALSALESTAPPVQTEQESFERMMQLRRDEIARRKRESRQAGCMVVLGVVAIMCAVWKAFRLLDDT